MDMILAIAIGALVGTLIGFVTNKYDSLHSKEQS